MKGFLFHIVVVFYPFGWGQLCTGFTPSIMSRIAFTHHPLSRPFSSSSTDDVDIKTQKGNSNVLPSLPARDNNKREQSLVEKEDSALPAPVGRAMEKDNNSPKTVIMMTQENRRVLVEELGYKRVEVDQLRVEMVPRLISERIQRPVDGVPSSWMAPSGESEMMNKLQSESKYPLKFPLLAISLVLTGKGVSDALITIVKVATDFPGASLSQTFMGLPVLGIDAFCLVVGVGLGTWTWKSMRD